MRLRAFALALCLAVNGIAIRGEGTGVHLTCRLSAIAEEVEEGRFACIGDYGTVTLDVASYDYLTDYLRADNGQEVTITIQPKGEK